MIYLDTSVALAHLLAEDRAPEPELWDEELVSSRLLEYELWSRLHGQDLGASHGDVARLLIGRLALVELSASVLDRARQPFPSPVRTLDALHLATASFLREQGYRIRIATYDARMSDAATAMGFEVFNA